MYDTHQWIVSPDIPPLGYRFCEHLKQAGNSFFFMEFLPNFNQEILK